MPSNLALAVDLRSRRSRGVRARRSAPRRAPGDSRCSLGGAANLVRDPHGGRNFEFFSEDPLLTGLMAGSAVAGAQSGPLISTLKHFALNDQETDRVVLDARIDRSAARESDLLAFEIAIEKGHPGSVMCAYDMVDGDYSCENAWLLNTCSRRLAVSRLRAVGLGRGPFDGTLRARRARRGVRGAGSTREIILPASRRRRRGPGANPASTTWRDAS